MHFLLKNSLFREVHFSFLIFFFVMIENYNLDVFVRFKEFALG